MTQKILVAYASIYGSTAEVADRVAGRLRQAGYETDLQKAAKVKDLRPYAAVVLGTALRMEKPLPEALKFARRHKAALQDLPLALFSVGIAMRPGEPEGRQKTLAILAPLLAETGQPRLLGLFAGVIDYAKMNVLLRLMFQQDKTGEMREGDWRDWDLIQSWADDLPKALFPDRTV